MSSLPRNPRPRGMSTQRRALMLAIACVLSVLAFQVVDRGRLTVNDFLEYWTAARLDLAGQDPYSPTAMYELEKQTGLHSEKPLMMWNPPWVLPFVVPLGLMSLGKARTLVLLLTLVIVFGCADWLWRFYGGAAQRRWVAWGLACTFAPAMVCITSGQIAPVVLLGVVLFLWLEQRSLHFAAGAAMLLIAFKPHLLYLFWLVAALWIVRNRRWPLAAGALAAIAAATAVAVLISKDLLLHYWAAWRSASALALYAPPLGGLLRMAFGWRRYWLQFVPALPGLAWCIWWFRKRPDVKWRRDLPLLLVVSVCTSPYGWLFDQVVLLPALLKRAVEFDRPCRVLATTALMLYVAANLVIAALAVSNHAIQSYLYSWAAPLWLVLYVATASPEVSTPDAPATALPNPADTTLAEIVG